MQRTVPSVGHRISMLGDAVSSITQRWIPDSWVVCIALTLVAMALAVVGAGASPAAVVAAWGGGVWSLLELGMQFTVAMVAAHACVASRPMHRLLDRLAGVPDPARPVQAVVLVGLFSMVSGYVNWALCIVGSALFVPFVSRRNPRADVRVLIASAYLGIGTIWQGGLSSSAALIMATPGNPLMKPAVGAPVIDRVLPVSETLFNGFNLIYLVVIGTVSLAAVAALHPRANVRTMSAEQIARMLPQAEETLVADTPAARLESSRVWCIVAAALLLYSLGHSLVTRGFGPTWTINGYNMVFLAVALLVQGRAVRFVQAMSRGAGTAAGIILQFPFYAGVFGVITSTGLGTWLGHVFVSATTATTFPLVVWAYSALLDMFVPSGGAKWLIEAPYLLPAAQQLGVSATTTLLAYSIGASNANLVQPFWALPILAVTGLRFGEVLGYTSLVAMVCALVNVVAMLLIPAAL